MAYGRCTELVNVFINQLITGGSHLVSCCGFQMFFARIYKPVGMAASLLLNLRAQSKTGRTDPIAN